MKFAGTNETGTARALYQFRNEQFIPVNSRGGHSTLTEMTYFPAGPRETGHAPLTTHIIFLAYSGRDVTRNVPASRLLWPQCNS